MMIHHVPNEPAIQLPVSEEERCSELVDAIFSVCLKQGLKLTKSRRALIQYLAQANRPMKAYDLAVAISTKKSTTYPPVVYRILEVLRANGCAHKLSSINSYVLLDPRNVAPRAYLICEKCEAADVICGVGIPAELAASANDKGFMPATSSVEILGVCAACREKDRIQTGI